MIPCVNRLANCESAVLGIPVGEPGGRGTEKGRRCGVLLSSMRATVWISVLVGFADRLSAWNLKRSWPEPIQGILRRRQREQAGCFSSHWVGQVRILFTLFLPLSFLSCGALLQLDVEYLLLLLTTAIAGPSRWNPGHHELTFAYCGTGGVAGMVNSAGCRSALGSARFEVREVSGSTRCR